MSSFNRSRAVLSERGAGKLDSFLLEYDIRNTCKYAVKLLLDGDVHDATAGGGGGAFLSLVFAQVGRGGMPGWFAMSQSLGVLTQSASLVRGCRRGCTHLSSSGRERDRSSHLSA